MTDCVDRFSESYGQMSSSKRCGLLSGCLGFVFLIVFISVCIDGVEPTEFALIQNNITQDIDRDFILQGGLHWVGLFYTLIKFPSTYKTLEFSYDNKTAIMPPLQTRTFEGLDLAVHFSFQYMILRDELPDLYKLLSNDYEKIFARVAKNSVLNTACQYVATDYWKQRANIGSKMLENLQWNLKPLHVEITGFQLLKIDLPDAYEESIVETEVFNQQIITEQVMQVVHVGEQIIRNIEAAGNRHISNTISEAAAGAQIIINEGYGNVTKQNIDGHTKALYKVKQQMKMDNSLSLLEYFKYQKIAELSPYTRNMLIVGKSNDLGVIR